MNKTLRVKMSSLLLAMTLAFIGFTSASNAQYCDWPSGFTTYDYYGYTEEVKVSEWVNNNYGPQVLINTTNKNDRYINTGVKGNVIQGRTYKIDVRQNAAIYFGYPYTSTRIWIDLNNNGKFDVTGTPVEYLGEMRNFNVPYYQIFHGSINVSVNFTVGCTSPLGDTRMRVITGYYYCPAGANNACYMNYDYYGWGYAYADAEDYTLTVNPDAPKSIPTDTPVYVVVNNQQVKVEDMTIWEAGKQYYQTWSGSATTTAYPQPQILFNASNQTGSTLEMYIQGPLPSTNIVWRALGSGNSNTISLGNLAANSFTDSDGKTRYRYVPGVTTGAATQGAGDFTGTSGGEYKLVFQIWSTGGGCPGVANRLFNVSWDNDMAASNIVSPLSNGAPRFTKYGVGQTIKFIGTYQNVGKNTVTKFVAKAYIRNKAGQLIDSLLYPYGDNQADLPIPPAGKVDITFGDKRYYTVDQFSVNLDLAADAGLDQEAYNNVFPRPNTPTYGFEVAYDVELQANAIFAPASGDVLIANRSYKGRAEFKNNGISPQSNIPCKMEIRNAETDKLETSVTDLITDIGIGRYNTKTVQFNNTFSIPKPGNYYAKIFVTAPQDQVASNDTMRIYFTVESGIAGVFTVGSSKETAAGYRTDRNFKDIPEMMDAIYYNGISGPVAFEFTDAVYNVNSSGPNAAWDLSSNILGLGFNAETNSIFDITFRPHSSVSGNKAGIVFNLASNIGVGVRIGQNGTPANANSIYNAFPNSQNANNKGYITFDGGAQKAFRFVNTNNNPAGTTHSSAFFLGAGSRNITIKNCVIDNGSKNTTTSASFTSLPAVSYTNSQFVYDDPYPGFTPNTSAGTKSTALFSAGVVLHNSIVSYLATSGTVTIGTLKLDTLPSFNNLIENNEISDFAYGIADVGYGPITVAFKTSLTDFNNYSNTFKGNFINNSTKAGIALGQERNSYVLRNRIMNVGDALTTVSTAGIQVGGLTRTGGPGYNNNDITIDGNQISDIKSNNNAFGIAVESVLRLYNTGAQDVQVFPKNAENTKVSNNIIWGLSNNGNSTGTRAGIALMTERGFVSSVLQFLSPSTANNTYFTRNDVVANNTIYINETAVSTGNVVAIAVQQAHNAGIYSNSIYVKDVNAMPGMNNVGSLIYYRGPKPGTNNGLSVNRNLFFSGNNDMTMSNLDLLRVVEVDNLNGVVYNGFNGEYRTLDQIQSWLKQSGNCLYGDFSKDFVFSNSYPSMMEVNPNMPKGSLQNNRGENINWISTDSRGMSRGVSGERFDIGAFEFTAPLYNEDVEVVTMTTPRSYGSIAGTFSDAQYVMTTSPTNVVTRIRNNGKLPQINYNAVVNIYRESSNGSFPTTPTLTTSTKVNMAVNESAEVDFKLNGNGSVTFTPETFSDLIDKGGNADYQTLLSAVNGGNLGTMKANVTPRYKIEVITGSDENNLNNVVTKVVRYYIKKSDLSMLISGKYQYAVESNTVTYSTDQVRSKLNYRNLVKGFNALGWSVVYPTPSTNGINNYDIFDRTSWESRAVNYADYTNVFWVDGENETPSLFEVGDVNNYLAAAGYNQWKKNLVIASQEAAANTTNNGAVLNNYRINVLRAAAGSNIGVYNTAGAVTKRLTGINIARDFKMNVAMPINPQTSSTYSNDIEAMPYALTSVNSATVNNVPTQLPGLTRDAMKFADATNTPIAAVATTNLDRNVIYMGLDWRHISDIETSMRGIIDYIVKNTEVIPVELTDFNANKLGNKVVLDWSTASEINSSKFEVEKALVTNTGAASFDKIAELTAAGQSKEVKFYGPVADFDVKLGNTYAYRLRMVDRNGEFSYSETKFVSLTSQNGLVELSEAQPNPASVNATFNFSLTQANNVTFTVYDLNGNAVTSTDANYASGNHSFVVDLAKLASGQYNVVLRTGEIVITRTLNVVK